MADIVDSSSVAFFHVCRMLSLADVEFFVFLELRIKEIAINSDSSIVCLNFSF